MERKMPRLWQEIIDELGEGTPLSTDEMAAKLMKQSPNICSALNSLEYAGLIKRVQKRNHRGRLVNAYIKRIIPEATNETTKK